MSRDVVGHVTIRFPIGHFLSVSFGTKPLSLTVSDIFKYECYAMVDMTLNDLEVMSTKFKVIHFGTYRLLINDFL